MLKELKKEGFASIIEVIVTSIIFIIATAGIFTAISTLKSQSGGNSYKRLAAIYAGKKVIDELLTQVDADTWNSGDLSAGVHSRVVDGYTINYFLTDDPMGCTVGVDCIGRRMTMNVYYTD